MPEASPDGWWRGGDGIWYPPDLHPDPAHRERHRSASGTRHGPVDAPAVEQADHPTLIADVAPTPTPRPAGGPDPGSAGRLRRLFADGTPGWVPVAVGLTVFVGLMLGGFVIERRLDRSTSAAPVTAARTDDTSPEPVPAAFEQAPGIVVDTRDREGAHSLPAAWYVSPTAPDAEAVLTEPPRAAGTYGSPDGRYVAVHFRPAAVSRGRYEILATDNGELVSRAEYEGQRAKPPRWSPDGSAIAYQDEGATYVHRVGGATSVAPAPEGPAPLNQLAFARDQNRTEVVWCAGGDTLLRLTAGDQPAEARTDQPASGQRGCSVAQLTDDDGAAVALVGLGSQVERVQVDRPGHPVELPSPKAAVAPSVRQVCSGLVVFGLDGDGAADRLGVYTLRRDTVVPSPRLAAADGCPMPSPDRRLFAMTTAAGPVVAVSTTTGMATEIAHTGTVVAWSADSRRVLVDGNGVFLVAADGSGGEEAHVGLADDTKPLEQSCRLADTGRALLQRSGRLVLYDLGADEAHPLGSGGLGDVCRVTLDGRWALSGALLVGVERADVGNLARVSANPGSTPAERSASVQYRWRGPQSVTSASDRTVDRRAS